MSTQSNDLGESSATRREVAQRTVARPVPAAESTPRSFRPATMQRCPNCGERNHSHASICATCGENLRVKPQKIRCRHCNHRASSILVVCPHCGRELQAARARWFYWAAPALLVLLFLGILVGQGGVLRPLQWTQRQISAAINWVQQLGERMDPQFSLEEPVSDATNPVPVAQANNAATAGAPSALPANDTANNLIDSGAITATQVISAPTVAPPTATATPLPTATHTALPPTATESPTATTTPTAAATATASNTPKPTNSPIPSPTVAATLKAAILLPTTTSVATTTDALAQITLTNTQRTGNVGEVITGTLKVSATRVPLLLPTNTPPPEPTNTATHTPLPTATPTPVLLPTPTPVQRTYTVQPDDTLSEIADSFNISVDTLMAANQLTQADILALRPGDILEIPGVGEPAAALVAINPVAPTPTAVPRTYALQAGETPGEVADRFGITVEALLAANGLSREDARRLQTGQILVIPGASGSVNSAPAAEVSNAQAAPARRELRLDAPQLRSPENGTQISCNGGDQLTWLPVNFVLADDLYLLHLGFVNGIAANGKENIVWVLEQTQPANNTIWNLDPGLCGLAPQEFGRKWFWYVEVVEGKTGVRTPVSPPSPLWSFRWN